MVDIAAVDGQTGITMREAKRVHDYFFGRSATVVERILFVKRERRLPDYAALLDDTQAFGNVWAGVTGRYRGTPVTVIATGVGPSMVGDCAYAVDRPGAACVYSGSCGGLADDQRIGSLFVARDAVSADGFSQHFGYPWLSAIEADEELTRSVTTSLARTDVPIRAGTSFTTGSVTAELNEAFWKLVPPEAAVVEMGAASFFSACAATGKPAAAMFWVTDLPRHGASFYDPLSGRDTEAKQRMYDRLPGLELETLVAAAS
jgi:nucleoside phosphorylase